MRSGGGRVVRSGGGVRSGGVVRSRPAKSTGVHGVAVVTLLRGATAVMAVKSVLLLPASVQPSKARESSVVLVVAGPFAVSNSRRRPSADEVGPVRGIAGRRAAVGRDHRVAGGERELAGRRAEVHVRRVEIGRDAQGRARRGARRAEGDQVGRAGEELAGERDRRRGRRGERAGPRGVEEAQSAELGEVGAAVVDHREVPTRRRRRVLPRRRHRHWR